MATQVMLQAPLALACGLTLILTIMIIITTEYYCECILLYEPTAAARNVGHTNSSVGCIISKTFLLTMI